MDEASSTNTAGAGESGPQTTCDTYSMDNGSRGTCLILGFDYVGEKNKPSSQLQRPAVEARPSAGKEAEMCEASFKDLGFYVKKPLNLESKQFKSKADQILSNMPEGVDAFALVLIGRAVGDKAAFIDGCVDFKNILKPFLQNSKLAGKPKLFIFDMGPKNVPRRASRDQKRYTLPEAPDVLLFDSSVTGLHGVPITHEGEDISPFIYYLTKALDDRGEPKDLRSIFDSVQADVLEHNKGQKQPAEPFIHDTLTKTLILPACEH